MLPVENVTDARPGNVWETGTSSATETIVFDLGSAQTISAIGFVRPPDKFESVTNFDLEANSSDSWGTPAFTHSGINGAVKTSVETFTGQIYRYWRVTFDKNASSDANQIGRLALGVQDASVSQAIDFEGFSEQYIDQTSTVQAEGGSYSDQRYMRRVWTVPISDISNSDKQNIDTQFEALGKHTPFWIQYDATELPNWHYVKFQEAPQFENTGHDGTALIWSVTLRFAEEQNDL